MSSAISRDQGGWMTVRVTARVRESESITSLHLCPAQGSPWRPFTPGQFLVLRLDIPGRPAPVLRHYSLSGAPGLAGSYRISVKRETQGLGSTHVHEQLQVGDLLQVQGPRGAFVLDMGSLRPVLLLSGGVGLTPMVSMLHALASTRRTAFFIHACENARVHALRDEVLALAASRPGLHVHCRYRDAAPADLRDGRCHSAGLLDRALLQSLLPLDDYEAYLCGPPAFMQAAYQLLRGLGLARERIAYEFFGPATVLDAPQPDSGAAPSPQVHAQAAPGMPAIPGQTHSVRFADSGLERVWPSGGTSLLDLAEACGLQPRFSCRAGVCGSCTTRLLSGAVRYVEEPLAPSPPGEILLCCAQPVSDVVLGI